MNLIRGYIRYLKDNPEGYWFKNKLFGWGWTPATWQGWLVTLGFVFLILLISLDFSSFSNPTGAELVRFFVKLVVAAVLIIAVCYRTGERPSWRWGLPEKYREESPKQ
jgi:hypothetical protein